MACILFMAGGLYWTASVGLLTLSALTAYPLMVMVGVVFSLLIFGAASWTTRNPVADSATATATPISLVGAVHTYDAVTGLPMYRLFLSLLKQALIRAQKEGGQAAVLVIELEHFTPETDAYAMLNRNLMYRVQAARVKSALRTTDVVARLAEARFAVLLEDVTTSEEVLAIAKKMQATIAHPVTLDRQELLLSSRIGISLSSRDGVDAQELIDAAVRALERTRVEGGSLRGTAVAAEASLPHPTSTLAA
ncbi:MAG: GGDEF domain-containing protein [Nitrospira sp.]|uniref:GGDEF domain-containing protein n=1 Tax=Nitrospira defluvii TaxID=330214 RepID=UPI001BB482BD|nr:GGDEF domain-containing protein [Nitrospira defluvii]MCS6326871.1 GGDEF domain-containing protein [Nitrospira sp.]